MLHIEEEPHHQCPLQERPVPHSQQHSQDNQHHSISLVETPPAMNVGTYLLGVVSDRSLWWLFREEGCDAIQGIAFLRESCLLVGFDTLLRMRGRKKHRNRKCFATIGLAFSSRLQPIRVPIRYDWLLLPTNRDRATVPWGSAAFLSQYSTTCVGMDAWRSMAIRR